MPENTSEERHQLLRMWGAEVVSSPAAGGSSEAVRVAKAMAAEHPDWVLLYQYGNPASASPTTRARAEILADLPTITHFVGGLGTTGTLIGIGRFFREHKPAVASSPPSRRTASWCTACATLSRASSPGSYETLMTPLRVRSPRRRAPGAWLLDGEGIFAGVWTGAILHAALAQAAKARARR